MNSVTEVFYKFFQSTIPNPNYRVAVAAKAKLSYESLAAAIKRLNHDRQVQTIWALYNNFTEFGGGERYARQSQTEDREPAGATA